MPPISSYRIVNAEGGRWMIMGPLGQAILANQDFASPELAAEAICKSAKDRGMGAKVITNRDGKPERVEVEGGVDRVPRRANVPELLTLGVSAEFLDFLDEIADETGEDRAEVVRKALGLLRIALDAKREGNGIAIVTPNYEVDQEITGF